jgi:hypothetical protein
VPPPEQALQGGSQTSMVQEGPAGWMSALGGHLREQQAVVTSDRESLSPVVRHAQPQVQRPQPQWPAFPVSFQPCFPECYQDIP